jgi:N-acetylmuramoyl-L-alanine amidase
MLAEALTCLALNIYHEARGEGPEGMMAVGQVTINRVADDRWPDTVCEVVYQPRQFSWTDDAPPVTEQAAWEQAQAIAAEMLNGTADTILGPDAVYFHAAGTTPYWSDDVHLIGRIGDHIFYAEQDAP